MYVRSQLIELHNAGLEEQAREAISDPRFMFLPGTARFFAVADGTARSGAAIESSLVPSTFVPAFLGMVAALSIASGLYSIMAAEFCWQGIWWVNIYIQQGSALVRIRQSADRLQDL